MTTQPTGYNLEHEMSAVDQIRAFLGSDDENVTLRLDSIEGQTQALELLDVMLEGVLAVELVAEKARLRAQRLERRGDTLRAKVLQVLEKIGVKKLERPIATVSIAKGVGSVHITDDAAIPLHYLRTSPDKALIKQALTDGTEVPGATLGNAPPTLRISTR